MNVQIYDTKRECTFDCDERTQIGRLGDSVAWSAWLRRDIAVDVIVTIWLSGVGGIAEGSPS
ncbi:hypothetical protein LOC71_21930 [Rhodopirellula sp. JC740]|uniref:Uncharacterized protein n=1 Tax=Rhodopirellula halodulae TaxID=2894198 RepID=A0ABS8NN35_9BACT|nr:hypothetical protein [Rhodopirellula sp. JC740]MCC9644945.1 hypothetical protein [Rhodopirellula sp. JC740]